MLLVLTFIMFIFIVFVLHTFLVLLVFHLVAQNIEQVDNDHILVCRLFECVLHPLVRLAANVDENIAL